MPKEAKSAAASEATATLSPAFSPQREFCYAEQHVSLDGYQAGVDNRFCNEKVLTAEVMRELQVANSHYSFKSSEDASLFFRRMFPHSQIATQLSHSMPTVQIKEHLPPRPSQI